MLRTVGGGVYYTSSVSEESCLRTMSVSWLAYGAGAVVRLLFCGSSVLENRPEISNPLNSWKRLVEGIHLTKLGKQVPGRIMLEASGVTDPYQ